MQRISIGRIRSVRGHRGELRVEPAARDLGRFARLERVWLDGTGVPEEGFAVQRAWEHKGSVVLQLDGVDSIEKAEPLVGREVLVPAEQAVELDEDEFFVHDLVGLQVTTDTGHELGRIDEVIEGPANDVYVVRGPLGEVLVPAVGAFVLSVDLGAGRMLVHELPGLLDPEDPV